MLSGGRLLIETAVDGFAIAVLALVCSRSLADVDHTTKAAVPPGGNSHTHRLPSRSSDVPGGIPEAPSGPGSGAVAGVAMPRPNRAAPRQVLIERSISIKPFTDDMLGDVFRVTIPEAEPVTLQISLTAVLWEELTEDATVHLQIRFGHLEITQTAHPAGDVVANPPPLAPGECRLLLDLPSPTLHGRHECECVVVLEEEGGAGERTVFHATTSFTV